jgi:hypothetical protein
METIKSRTGTARPMRECADEIVTTAGVRYPRDRRESARRRRRSGARVAQEILEQEAQFAAALVAETRLEIMAGATHPEA